MSAVNDAATGVAGSFMIPSGRPLPAQMLERRRVDGDVYLTVEVGPEEWTMVDMIMLFHLGWDARNPGEIVEGGNVQIELRLSGELDDDDRSVLDGVADTEIAAAVAGLEDEHPLKVTESWYATEVTELVPLPPALAAKGEVRSGFTTVWRTESA